MLKKHLTTSGKEFAVGDIDIFKQKKGQSKALTLFHLSVPSAGLEPARFPTGV
jgi:hypothetical protein